MNNTVCHPLSSLLVLLAALWLIAPRCAEAALVIDADRQFDYAQSRLDTGAFDEAVAEFNRFIHFFPDDPRVTQARFESAMAHFMAKRYPAAIDLFRQLTGNYSGRPLETEAFLMLSRSHAAQGHLDLAKLDLHNLMALTSDPAVIDRAHHALGWLQVDQYHWKKAVESFNRISADRQDHFRVPTLQQELLASDQIPTKSPTVAGMLSIVPGGGQLYCNRYQDAVTAFLLNAALIGAAWQAFDEEMYFLGGAISFVEFGFYAGNIYGAISGAHKYNRNSSDQFRQRLKQARSNVPLSLVPTSKGAALCLHVDF